MLLAEKRDGSAKGRACASGNPEQSRTPKEEASSPAEAVESALIAGAIEAKE